MLGPACDAKHYDKVPLNATSVQTTSLQATRQLSLPMPVKER